ncbi:MAG: class I SAM-dependent methyltransferase [Candidatus Cloacimonetes bacterium]|jgi:hypothetical protein|nr:class I SAM-dependent methyltransferase [Candidatus Cloacimonadota bacterium]
MAIPILDFWKKYYSNPDEGLGSTYERFIINDILDRVVKDYDIKSVLEVPSFGFTGLSGINSLWLSLNGMQVNVVDSDKERLNLVSEVWNKVESKLHNKMLAVDFTYLENFDKLPFDDNSFDMIWNFSAMWFVQDLELFLSQLANVSKKIILIMVPNRTGLGYLHQKYTGKKDLSKYLIENNIKSSVFIPILKKYGWNLIEDNYLDCPLWPDIGMSKEDFFSKLFLRKKPVPKYKKTKDGISIIDYYIGAKPEMKLSLNKYKLFENFAPGIFKKIWAHHHYYLFVPEKNIKI